MDENLYRAIKQTAVFEGIFSDSNDGGDYQIVISDGENTEFFIPIKKGIVCFDMDLLSEFLELIHKKEINDV